MTTKLPKVNSAIILAGGKARRMIDFSTLPERLKKLGFNPEKMHKSMIPVGGKPVLEHTILWLKKGGIKKIIIGAGYQKKSIINYFKNGEKWGVKINYVTHTPEGGTGDALKEDMIKSGITDDYFFVTNADQITSFPLKKLIEVHFSDKNLPIATIGLVCPTFPFGEVDWNAKTHRILAFREKPTLKISTNGGFYLFSKEIKGYLKGDLERYTFPLLAKKNKIKGYFYQGFWDTINTIKDWERVNSKFQKYAKS